MHNLDVEEIYQKLIEIANQDGIISKDEQELIDSVQKNIAKYFKILTDSYKDEIITADEQNSLYEIRRNIMDEALKVAKKDEKVTQDEFTLLRSIREILDDIEEHEHY